MIEINGWKRNNIKFIIPKFILPNKIIMKTKALIVLLTSLSCLLQSCTSWKVSAGTPPNQNTNIGQRVKVLWGTGWYDGTIIDSRNNEYYIHYDGWSDSQNEWVTVDKVKFVNTGGSNSGYYVGQTIRVLQRGVWYDATIVQMSNNQYYVKYTNFNEYEWITPDRIQPSNTGSNSGYYIGQLVEVEQRGTWYAASIIQINNNQYYINYTNFPNEYEWVTPDRIRLK
jgi:hypothetical protein